MGPRLAMIVIRSGRGAGARVGAGALVRRRLGGGGEKREGMEGASFMGFGSQPNV